MFKGQKGITLIALVITIIVLLILAGVSIAMLSGSDSTPAKASEAVIKDAIAAGKDAVTLTATDAISDFYEAKYVNNNNDSTITTAGAAVLDKTFTSSNVTITVDKTAKTVTITSNSDNTYSSVGAVNDNGGITWTDHFGD